MGTLHKLADFGASGKRSHWNQLLNYLEGHAIGNASASTNPKFDSPLPPFTGPSQELQRELLDAQGPKHEETPLRIACKAAPSYIVAALCHLGPEAARMADAKGRLPLHWACRMRGKADDKEAEKVLKILVLCYPEGLLHRDEGGRTPFHYLFWYHASTRSAKLVTLFCQELPTNAFVGLTQMPQDPKSNAPELPEIPTPSKHGTPANACIVHDAKHGALPLHYALMEGASKDVIKVLLNAYPDSKSLVDSQGRTALHWYLGAGALAERPVHVSGEIPDPNALPYFEQHVSANIIHLLLGSKVARTQDSLGRLPLHWAVHLLSRHYYHQAHHAHPTSDSTGGCLSLKGVELILDHNVEALCHQEHQGRTPLHLLFDVVAEQQQQEWSRRVRNQTVRDKLDLIHGGPDGFSPPLSLVELLLVSPGAAPNTNLVHHAGERPSCAAHVEDETGRLPLHAALHVATSSKVVQALIQSHPTSLVHTTEEQMQTPLHFGLNSPYATPLQTVETMQVMLQAYVTSRHGTFVNGRLALKMEDATGRYPLHYACEHMAPVEVIRTLLEKYPKASRIPNGVGDLPLHGLLEPELFGSVEDGGIMETRATLAAPMGWTSETEDSFRQKQAQAFQEKMKLLIEPLLGDVESLKIASFDHGMTPLHIAVAFDVVSYKQLYHIVDGYPAALSTFTTVDGHSYCPLDFHEMRRAAATDEEKWHMVRELLFSFCPTLEAHRTKDDLLDRCVQLIRDEMEGLESAHSIAQREIDKEVLPELAIAETLSNVEAPKIDTAAKPKAADKKKVVVKKADAKKPKKPKSSKKKSPEQLKSIYDDDDDHGYVVSPTSTFDDEDDDFFSQESEDEEFYSDEEDSRYDDSSLFDENTKPADSHEESVKGSQSFDSVLAARNTFETTQSNKSGAKEEIVTVSTMETPQESPESDRRSDGPLFLSTVAQRLWIFFAMYRNPDSLDDHYALQVDAILDGVDFKYIQKLLALMLPSYAADYVEEGTDFGSAKVEDVANLHCKAIIQTAVFFIGRYDFRPSPTDSLLLHRSGDNDIVILRATEHLIIAEEEEMEGFEATIGDAEEQIWSTGEAPAPTSPQTKTSFRVTTRPVCFKFMRNPKTYESEVECRKALGIPVQDGADDTRCTIVPLINHYNAKVGDKGRRQDIKYRQDLHDERFERIPFIAGSACKTDEDSVFLPDYPFAIVMPYRDDGDLYDFFYHQGLLEIDRIREIGSQVGRSLKSIHEQGLLHGNVCFRNIKTLGVSEGDASATLCWALADLSFACRQDSGRYMAGISSNGTAQFATSVFPPEMFVKLSPAELVLYRQYWDFVETNFSVTIDKAIIDPRFDASTGDAYVLRCHFLHGDDDDKGLPSLPYSLLCAREAGDIWSLGQVLFTLCSSGHPLFASNMRTGHLLEYDLIGRWDQQEAEAMVYGHVQDPLAQDILLHLLAPYEDRAALTMDTVMSHPFFAKEKSQSMDKVIQRIVEQRSIESSTHRRVRQQKLLTQGDEEWLKARTVHVSCWDLDFQMRMHVAPSELIRREFTKGHNVAHMPYSLIMLPYKVTRNKSGQWTPSTKKGVALAEAMGVRLLALGKACQFAIHMEDFLRCSGDIKPQNWSQSEISEGMGLSDEFKELDDEMRELAGSFVVSFRDDPMFVARKLVQNRAQDIQSCFEESNRAFLYTIDEFEGVPVSDGSNRAYGVEVNTGLDEIVQRGLPLMHICVLYARGVANGVAGLVKLIFEGAYPLVPPSWAAASAGMSHSLDEARLLREANVLREAIVDMDSGAGSRAVDDVLFFRSLFQNSDPKRTFADMKWVTNNGEGSLWTSDDGVKKIEAMSEQHSVTKAFRLKAISDAKIAEQERRIVELKKRIEELEFRKEHNLENPLEEAESWEAKAN